MTQDVKYKLTAWPLTRKTSEGFTERRGDNWEFYIHKLEGDTETLWYGSIPFRSKGSAVKMVDRLQAAARIRDVWDEPSRAGDLNLHMFQRPNGGHYKWDPTLGEMGGMSVMVALLRQPLTGWDALKWPPPLSEATAGLHYFDVRIQVEGSNIIEKKKKRQVSNPRRPVRVVVQELKWNEQAKGWDWVGGKEVKLGPVYLGPAILLCGSRISSVHKKYLVQGLRSKRVSPAASYGGVIEAVPTGDWVWDAGTKDWRAITCGLEQYQEGSRIGFRKPGGTLPHPQTEKIDPRAIQAVTAAVPSHPE